MKVENTKASSLTLFYFLHYQPKLAQYIIIVPNKCMLVLLCTQNALFTTVSLQAVL